MATPDWVEKELKHLDRRRGFPWSGTKTIATLLSSPRAGEVWRLLEGKTVNDRFSVSGSAIEAVLSAVQTGMRGPDRFQRMTKGERTKLAGKVQRAARNLRELLGPLLSDGVPGPFQSNFDLYALEQTLKYQQGNWYGETNPLDDEDVFGFCRFGIYYPLMKGGLPSLLEAIEASAEWWAEEEQFIAMPNDANAERLYFIRIVSQTLFRAFDAPLRALTLELTAVFFDCQDIDEASLSRLAPVSTLGVRRIDAAALNSGK